MHIYTQNHVNKDLSTQSSQKPLATIIKYANILLVTLRE